MACYTPDIIKKQLFIYIQKRMAWAIKCLTLNEQNSDCRDTLFAYLKLLI